MSAEALFMAKGPIHYLEQQRVEGFLSAIFRGHKRNINTRDLWRVISNVNAKIAAELRSNPETRNCCVPGGKIRFLSAGPRYKTKRPMMSAAIDLEFIAGPNPEATHIDWHITNGEIVERKIGAPAKWDFEYSVIDREEYAA
ncbi:hypothetical protein ELG97_37120 [Rhizobium leguminosarum]|uniref:hypothetical protein n=1 Tax=Rhizobium leguminosarum TaxID=384 RepID=UPI00102FB7C5|nr:hypothetical protein [Rhizobium leguminosarum]TBE73853.1 hypothetical protein ELG97_37120 [Rhizobium leguminosarum]